MTPCPCCSDQLFTNCCEPYLAGTKFPSTPEALMRSRYSAYSLANTNYIAETMRSPAADNFDIEDAREWAAAVIWIKLKVKRSFMENGKGFVEFEAYYEDDKQKHKMHELSEFHLIDERWYYVNGQVLV